MLAQRVVLLYISAQTSGCKCVEEMRSVWGGGGEGGAVIQSLLLLWLGWRGGHSRAVKVDLHAHGGEGGGILLAEPLHGPGANNQNQFPVAIR